MAWWYIIRILKNWQSHFFKKNSFLPKFGQKGPEWAQKKILDFLKNFVMLVFLRNNLKSKLIYLVIDILSTRLAKFWVLSYGSKCCQPIKLQDSLKCNIVRMRWTMKFIFCKQINIEVFCKVILSFWVSVTRHMSKVPKISFHIFAISP